MNCKRCRQSLYDYLDNSLEPDLSEAIQVHLDTCPDCRGVYSQEREWAHRIREVAVRLNEQLHFQFQASNPAVQKPAKAKRFPNPLFLKWAMVAVLMSLLIGSVMYLWFSPPKKGSDQMTRNQKQYEKVGNHPRGGLEPEEKDGTIAIITMEDDSGQLNETHFMQESAGVITDITVEVTALREIGLRQANGKQFSR